MIRSRSRKINASKEYIPQMIYGAFDGVVTTFAVVAAGFGAGFSPVIVVVLGLANLFADGFSMGSSAYLAQQSQKLMKDQRRAFPIAFVTFVSFLIIGLVPVLPYLIEVLVRVDWNDQLMFGISIALTALMFVWIGMLKAQHHKKAVVSAISESFVLGIISAGLAFGVGVFLRQVFGIEA